MKQKNFPGRKNARRIGASERLAKAIDPERAKSEGETLKQRIMPHNEAEKIYTKKSRIGKARIRI